jgi:hypothetical protein
MTMADLTYMDCWHYIAPLIPITSDRMTTEIYVMVFQALSESVRDGYVSAPDLIRVLREEYEIDIVGG